MNKLFIIITFFLTSCSLNSSRNYFDFSNQMSFDEFKNKLEEYAINNPYPNIDD